jgi:hypothetical protein
MACSTGGIQAQVEQAARAGFTRPRTYDCPKAGVCRWQQQAEIAGRKLCPPRDALGRGLDPRVTLF